ncbi:hypothetical protein QVD17_11118 [Tagetes erecta]|uniref:Uncharacterized protein n=1 Tax=Tagetes erecta TaxID=13708 RepID=A0AAD8L4N5_TARER|nr:hypothetical protein QVD17_11118 [Tagetes erecta]
MTSHSIVNLLELVGLYKLILEIKLKGHSRKPPLHTQFHPKFRTSANHTHGVSVYRFFFTFINFFYLLNIAIVNQLQSTLFQRLI